MARNLKFLQDLVQTPSQSGMEHAASQRFIDECKSGGCKEEFLDNFGNGVVSRENHSITGGFKTILLSGHVDEIPCLVTMITDNGFLHIMSAGGFDRRPLVGAYIQVLSEDGNWINGVIGKKPIHLEEDGEYEKATKMEDLLVDLGCSSKEEVENLGIHPGSYVTYRKGLEDLTFGPKKELIMSEGLDDKIAVYIVAEVMKRINVPNGYKIYGASMAGEETGTRGCQVVAGRLNPDISIDLDVTFSTDSDAGISKEKLGDIELGKGVVIAYGPDKSRKLAKELKDLAKKNGIKYQEEATRAGGTNTDAIQRHARDCETMLLSIPNRNMHTNVEICHWDDVEAAIDLLVKWIESL